MAKDKKLTKDGFERLLDWLDADRDQAAQKYESIRIRLIKILQARGCHTAEELADETIDRVMKKPDEFFDTYEGKPEAYFCAVARNVFYEFTRRPKSVELPPAIAFAEKNDEDSDRHFDCLSSCLESLQRNKKEFIIDYYRFDKGAKIRHRTGIRKQLGITDKALRVRAFRIRRVLKECVSDCVNEVN